MLRPFPVVFALLDPKVCPLIDLLWAGAAAGFDSFLIDITDAGHGGARRRAR